MAKIKINGIEVDADESMSIMDVINENNLVNVPKFCHYKELSPTASKICAPQ